jgi:hypothetical protein
MMLAFWVALVVAAVVYVRMADGIDSTFEDAEQRIRDRLRPEQEMLLQPLLQASRSSGEWIDFWYRVGLVHVDPQDGVIDCPTPSDAFSTLSGGAIAIVNLVRGQTHDSYARKASELAVMLAAPRGVRIVPIDPVHVGIEILSPADPLGVHREVVTPDRMEDFMLPIGVTETGHALFDLRERSGWLIAGAPGSGKSGSLQAIMATLCASSSVELAVVDGKGGSEWDWLRNRAFRFDSQESSLEDIRLSIEHVHSIMLHRLQTIRERVGRSNVWGAGSTPTEAFPLVVTFIDECQFLFDQKMSIGAAEKKAREVIIAMVTDLIRRGRSVGHLTVLVTQKPTTDAIPSAIRENCGFRMCFAVSTDDAGVAALGDSIRSSQTVPWELRLPTDRGVCVTDLGENGFARVRCSFMSEEHASASIGSKKARDPQLISTSN